MEYSSMSRTRTISSWPRSNVVVSTSSGRWCRPAEHLAVGPGDPGRGVPQAVAVGVLADREQQLADRAATRSSSNGPIGSYGEARVIGSITSQCPDAAGARLGERAGLRPGHRLLGTSVGAGAFIDGCRSCPFGDSPRATAASSFGREHRRAVRRQAPVRAGPGRARPALAQLG